MLEEQIDNKRWYIIHAYSGQEDRVKKNLEQRIQTMDVKDKMRWNIRTAKSKLI